MQARERLLSDAGTAGIDSTAFHANFCMNPAEYLCSGLALIPIPRGFKGPRVNGWQHEENAVRREEDAVKLNGCNIGLAHPGLAPARWTWTITSRRTNGWWYAGLICKSCYWRKTLCKSGVASPTERSSFTGCRRAWTGSPPSSRRASAWNYCR